MPKKGVKRPLGAPPTNEELSAYSETELLYKSNLFRLSTAELIKEVVPPQSSQLEVAVRALRGEILSLPPAELSWEDRGIGKLPLVSHAELSGLRLANHKVSLPWAPPEHVELVGSYLLRTVVRPSLDVDVAVRIPRACLLSKDYLDHRYVDKRQLYLAHLGAQLAKPSAATAATAAATAGAAADDGCPGRRPYHTVLTATGSVYQQWQARIMYHHWKKASAAGGKCTDMAAFTRLCATAGGRPDGLEGEIPTLFTVELSAQVLASHFHFGVLNRPNSVKQLMESTTLLAEIRKTSDYVLILETDHVIMRPIPNLATPEKPAAFVFGYMFPQPSQQWVVEKYWPGGSYKSVQPVGPSPLLIHLDQLRRVYQKWLDFSLGLRSNSEAERVIQGWVQEMWGYSIAAASEGIVHRLVEEFQVEPGALSTEAQLAEFAAGRFYIFHYTYQFEYMLDGTPCQPWNIGEWSLDKRHFNQISPAYPLPQPPPGANAAGVWLLNAWNEAMGSIPSWPSKQPAGGEGGQVVQTLYGRRRLDWFSRHANGFEQEALIRSK